MKQDEFLDLFLNHKKEQKIYEDSVFLEFKKNYTYVTVFATEEDNYLISELVTDEDTELNENQKNYLQEFVHQIKIPKGVQQEDNYFNNGVKREDFY